MKVEKEKITIIIIIKVNNNNNNPCIFLAGYFLEVIRRLWRFGFFLLNSKSGEFGSLYFPMKNPDL